MSSSESEFLGFSEDECECVVPSLENTRNDEVSRYFRAFADAPEPESDSDTENVLAICIEGDESEVDFLSGSEDEERENYSVKPIDPSRFYGRSDTEHQDEIILPDSTPSVSSKPKAKKINKSTAKKTKKSRMTTRATAAKQKRHKPRWQPLANDVQMREVPQCGLTLSVPPAKTWTPYQYFRSLFDDEIIENITKQTNLYSVEKLGESIEVSKNEIEQFLGMLLLMGIHKVPNYRMNWGTATRYAPIADVMTRNRFEQIKRMLHFADNSRMKQRNEPGYDKLFKVRPFVTAIRQNFLRIEPLPEQSIDEIMIPSKARSPLRQYNKNKPHRFGINVKGRAGKDGILHDFDIYTGKSGEQPSGDWGISGDVVLKLVATLPEHKQVRIFGDNWFSSYSLAMELKNRGFQYTGTIRPGRISNANFIADKELMAKGRGSYDAYISSDNIIIVTWIDNKAIHLISTYNGVMPLDIVNRWSTAQKKFISVDRPMIVRDYNQNMGGIDLNDFLVALYRTSIGTKKYYMRIFMHFLDAAIVNGWLLYRRHTEQRGDTNHMSLLDFRIAVADYLILYGKAVVKRRGRPTTKIVRTRKKHRVTRKVVPAEARVDNFAHWPVVLNQRVRCFHCDERNHFTSFGCSKCDVPLCVLQDRNCFVQFHNAD
nr:piggyBac transposable element-derived protein 3-like [Aedes albopictus]